MRVSNLNSLSAVIDRLIVENLKLISFVDTDQIDKINVQIKIIDLLKLELAEILNEIKIEKYNSIEEQRTFTSNILRLCLDNYFIGKLDSKKLDQNITDIKLIKNYILTVRACLEDRAYTKNIIDR